MNDVDEIVVGANGSIHVAPVGTAAPADPVEAYGAGWVDLGYASEDGVTLTVSKELGTVDVWQSFFPGRRMVTGRDLAAAFVLRQWNEGNIVLAWGGGEVTHVVADGPPAVVEHWRYEPPAPEDVDERTLAVDWVDGTKHYRLIIVRGMVTENVETKLAKADAADLPITFGIIGEDGVVPWFLLTDDPAFAAS